MNLRPRILLLTGLLIVVSAMAAWSATRGLAERIIEQWAVRYAEKQVLYDKARTLQPILRETALSRQLVSSERIRAWARHPDDPELTRQAIAEMENYRPNFADRSYFVALRGSGRYYHNNAKDEFAGRQLRYTLDAKKPADSWFYDIIRQQRDIHINVNPDINLGVTKLWIDVLIRDGNDILGVAGTGLDLTSFIRDVVDTTQPGITTLFVDHDGAIQAYRDESLIDFASITKTAGQHNSIDLLFDRAIDRTLIHAVMKELETEPATVISRFVERDGKRYLAGIAYLPEINWYEITLLDLDVLLPLSSFATLVLVYLLTLLTALVLFYLLLGHLILKPIRLLEQAIGRVRDGPWSSEELSAGGSDEISRLMGHFRDMANSVWQSRQQLEAKVRERTEALEYLSKTDEQTELLNRRGMTERIEAEISRARRERVDFGILWLDVDRFKEINDKHGHAMGDRALVTVADLIRSTIRPYDSAARWGGDEFLVLVHKCDAATLAALGERMRAAVAGSLQPVAADGRSLSLSVSIGGIVSRGDEGLERVLQRADRALYDAKSAGRNCFRLFSDTA
ncbi:MAG: diguanylate cyclase [Gallionellaceae bacterium]|nr:diguanylate cyclase [Gallionellaceae bacterium]